MGCPAQGRKDADQISKWGAEVLPFDELHIHRSRITEDHHKGKEPVLTSRVLEAEVDAISLGLLSDGVSKRIADPGRERGGKGLTKSLRIFFPPV